jgi:hypothetical protein
LRPSAEDELQHPAPNHEISPKAVLRCPFLCLQERSHLPLEGCSNAQSLIARRISGFRRKSRNDAAVVEMWPAVCWPTLAVVDSSSSAAAGEGGGA